MLIVPTSPAFSCLRFLFVLLTRPTTSALVFKIYWGNHDQRVVWTVEQVNHVWTQNPGIMSGHKTRESCLDTKHVNRVWTLEHLNQSLVWTVEAAEHWCGQAIRLHWIIFPICLSCMLTVPSSSAFSCLRFLFVLLTKPSASALVF